MQQPSHATYHWSHSTRHSRHTNTSTLLRLLVSQSAAATAMPRACVTGWACKDLGMEVACPALLCRHVADASYWHAPSTHLRLQLVRSVYGPQQFILHGMGPRWLATACHDVRACPVVVVVGVVLRGGRALACRACSDRIAAMLECTATDMRGRALFEGLGVEGGLHAC